MMLLLLLLQCTNQHNKVPGANGLQEQLLQLGNRC